MKKILSIFALFISLGLFSACNENSDDLKPMESVSPSVQASNTEDPRVQQIPPLNTSGIVCTQEAKICPDGTSVGRTGPNCDFSPCSGEISPEPAVTGIIQYQYSQPPLVETPQENPLVSSVPRETSKTEKVSKDPLENL